MKQCTCYALRAIDCTCKPAKYGELYTSPTAKQEQGEPVAVMELYTDGWDLVENIDTDWLETLPHGTKLYTTPQQRTWVGLTDVEWMNIVNKDQAWFGQRPDEVAHEVAKLVEAKLKEKNGL
jgi:hypothetical protein